MNQNYINIFHNEGDGVTVQYGNKIDAERIEIDSISFEPSDLIVIANALIEMSEELEG
tara:strand:+ start:464 stop:637 length:174 start_codon:yes stop_codon:yes gene_type:complete